MYYSSKKINSGRKKATYYVKDFSGGAEMRTDDRIKPLSCASEIFNFSCINGALRDGGGVTLADVGVGPVPGGGNIGNAYPERVYYFKTYNENSGCYEDRLLIFYGSYIYEAKAEGNETPFSQIIDLQFTKAPSAVRYTYNGKNVIIFSGEGESMKIYDGETVEVVEDAPAITSMCVHGERLFATEAGEKTTLWYSDDFDPANWDVSLSEAGFIDLRDERGSLLKVVEFGGYVYVFRNYGITRITAYGDQTEFAADGISASCGKIYGDSVTVCGDKIAYLAEDGFYLFSGGATQRFLTQFDDYFAGVDNSDAKGVFFNGELFVKLKANFPESGLLDVVLRYNFAKKSANFLSGFGVDDLAVYDGEKKYKLLMLCRDSNSLGEFCEKNEYFGGAIKKIWRSATSDLGKPEAQKTICGISLFADYDTRVSIISERGVKTVRFYGKKEDQYKKISLRGKAFSFLIINNIPESKVARLKIYFEYGER